MIHIVESNEVLEVQSPMPAGRRILFGIIALFPLIAPYELIIKIDWQSYFNFVFLFAFIISLGAVAVSAFLIWAAIAGLSSNMKFDRATQAFTYAYSAPILPMRTVRYPLDALHQMQVEKHEWSEGAPSYTFTVLTNDGKSFKSGSSWEKSEIEAIQYRVHRFLGRRSYQ